MLMRSGGYPINRMKLYSPTMYLQDAVQDAVQHRMQYRMQYSTGRSTGCSTGRSTGRDAVQDGQNTVKLLRYLCACVCAKPSRRPTH